ncbi:MAG: acetyltransferase [Gammaproteobacteria bacterium]|nr:MAG: acetyltransferase [Gammaproteobacteria bacterium]
MFLKETKNGHLVEVLALKDLFDPFNENVVGRLNFGEEAQEPESFSKSGLAFLSGEALPRCWVDPHYRDDELKRA